MVRACDATCPYDSDMSDMSDETDVPYRDDDDRLPRFRRVLDPPSSASTDSSIIQYEPLPGSSLARGTRVKERLRDKLCRIEFCMDSVCVQ